MHLLNPNATLVAAVAITLEAGVRLAAACLLTGRLWLSMGVHFAWNFTQGGIFGAAVSGQASTGLLRSLLQGPALLTGGDFGAEASAVAVVVCGLFGAYVKRAHSESASLPHRRVVSFGPLLLKKSRLLNFKAGV